MNIPLANEKQLLADIEQLREQFTQTQDLYREVCALLFFRYGITPTANKLYQLVRKGSMSAPADALNKFWEELREKSRVRIEHPGLPDALKAAAGDLVATLWTTAQTQANETLTHFQAEAQIAVTEAKLALMSAEADRETAIQSRQETQTAFDQANERIEALGLQVAATNATNASLASQLQEAKAEISLHTQRFEDARRDFAAELEKRHASIQLAEERHRAVEARALLEIDRERTAASKLQKELEACRVAEKKSVELLQSETAHLQRQLGDMRQKIGTLEGSLQAITLSRDALASELHDGDYSA
jgi:hypothetical protein